MGDRALIVTETEHASAPVWQWQASLEPLAQRLQQHATAPWRAVLLVPFAALIPEAREAWRRHWPGPTPRIETPLSWAQRLLPWQPGEQDFSGDVGRDILVAQRMWQGLKLPIQRGPWGDAMTQNLREHASLLLPLAQAQPPSQRQAWAQEVAAQLQGTWSASTQRWEGALWSTALAWLGVSACQTDILWAPQTRAQTDWLAVLPGDTGPLPQALLQHWGAGGLLLPPLVPADLAPAAVQAMPCHDLAQEALAAAGQVWHALEHEGAPQVALVSQDRRVVRRATAWLASRGVVVQDEAGWRLSTTRAGAELWALLQEQAAHWGERMPLHQWLQRLQQAWVASAPSHDWQHDAAAEQVARALGLRHPRSHWQALDDAVDKPMPASVFKRWVRQTLEYQNFSPPRPAQSAQVRVLPTAHVLGRNLTHWVMPGCDHVSLPMAPSVQPGLSLAQRNALGLPSREQLSERLGQAVACVTAMPQVRLLWRRQHAGEALLPSPWLQRWLAPALEASNGPAAMPGVLGQRWRAPSPVRPAPCAAEQLPARVSATSLRRLRQCPYQFYVHDVLGLRAADEVEPLATRRELGTWLHDVLKRFHDDPRQYQTPAVQAQWLQDCAQVARATHQLTDARFLPFASLWAALAKAYLDHWQHEQSQGVRCEHVEHRLEMPWHGTTLVGALDRVDQLASGNEWRVVDYKFEAPEKSRKRVRLTQEDWQAAVYTALWQHAKPQASLSMAYLTISDRGLLQSNQPVQWHHPQSTVADRQAHLEALAEDWQRLRQGEALQAMGNQKACTVCQARGVCRRDFRAGA
ncbi:MAG: PD-(D/E)XK nuclease family protein [Proteobacteria bacterium]|nr:PD-(D/E)XK nuclease family protein [Pseudomonadota bacterium]